MATKKYVSLTRLQEYDAKIKAKMKADDEAALAAAQSYADGLADNYEAAGNVATAKQELTTYVDGKVTTINGEIAKTNAAVEAAQAQADKGVSDAAAAKTAADTAQSEVDALESYVGTIPEDATATDVVGYINEKTTGIASTAALTELTNRVATAEGAIDAIEEDYLKAADKTELSNAIAAEAERADTAEKVNAAAIKAISDDYLKAADKTELEGKITTNANAIERLTNGVSAEEVDGVNDLIQYVKDHGAEVTGMKNDITANATAIATEQSRAEGVEAELTAAVEKAQDDATKANTDLAAEVTARTEADEALDGRVSGLEAKFTGTGEGSVANQIATAKQEAIDAAASAADTKDAAILETAKKYADDEDAKIETSIATLTDTVNTKAAAADLTALSNKVGAVEDGKTVVGMIEEANTATAGVQTALDNYKTSNDAAVGKKADQTALEAEVTRAKAAEEANAAAIAEFVECSEEEINAMFQTQTA